MIFFKTNFLYKALIFVLLLVLADRAVGYFFEYAEQVAFDRNPYSWEMTTKYTMEKVDSQVVVIGASDAKNCYDSAVIEKALGKSVYNCGLEGYEFYYQNAMVNGILDRYSPELVIWAVRPSFLSTPLQLDMERISILNPYCGSHPLCREAVMKKSQFEWLKLMSHSYKHNSRLFTLLAELRNSNSAANTHGYAPLTWRKKNIQLKPLEFEDDLDPEVLAAFEKTLQRCREKGIKVVFAFMPCYFEMGNYKELSQYVAMKETVEKYGFQLIDELYTHEDLVKPEMFSDSEHLNPDGAALFTQMLMDRIR